MPWISLLLLVCFGSELTSAHQDSCPRQCICTDQLSNILCANFSSTSPPLTLPSSARYLKIQGNDIVRITNGTFKEYNQIHTLDLSENSITNFVGRDFFRNLNRLHTLLLQDNQLNTSAIEQLKLPQTIRIINLGSNILNGELLPPASWDGLHKLYLQFNSITNFSASFFYQCSRLQEMNASHNSIESLQKVPSDVDFIMHELSVLDLSWNFIMLIDPNYFRMFPNLTHLFLQGNQISTLKNIGLMYLTHLKYLDLSHNYFEIVPPYLFTENTGLLDLHLTFLPNLTTINPKSFHGLSNLQRLSVNHNKKLSHLHIHSFQQLRHLKMLDLSNNALRTLHEDIFANLSLVEEIALKNNPWSCDCNLKWLVEVEPVTNQSINAINLNDLKCASPSNITGQYFKDIPSEDIPCKHPTIGHFNATHYFPIGKPAVLNCEANGDPIPVTIWQMPTGKRLYHHQAFVSLDELQPMDAKYHQNHPWHEYKEYPDDDDLHKKIEGRIHILHNGSLYFDFVVRQDAGYYTCIAQNKIGNASVTIIFLLDFSIIPIRTQESMMFGLATSGSVFVIALVVGLIRYAVQLCAQRIQKQKRRTIREIIKSLEAYRVAKIDKISAYKSEKMDKISAYKSEKIDKISQYKSEKWDKFSAYKSAKVDQFKQAKENTVTSLAHYLKTTREHYAQQVTGIKENCSEQVQKLRENYSQRISRLKDYKTHQVEKIRDNYHAQLTKIKEYGSGQMEKLREQYKTQQNHVFKLLELMNLGNCRGAVVAEMNSDSILFEPDITIDIDPTELVRDHFIENISLADSEDYMTASSSSDISSADEPSGPIMLDVGKQVESHVTIDNNTSARSNSSEEESAFSHLCDPPNYSLEVKAGTSHTNPCHSKPKGEISSHSESAHTPSSESSLGYEISIISAKSPDWNTDQEEYIPRESSV